MKYEGPRHFDAHAYRTEDYEGVKEFARGCMRTYLVFKEKSRRWNADKEIQALLKETSVSADGTPRYAMGGEPVLSADGSRLVDAYGRPSYVTSAGSGPRRLSCAR